MTAYHENVQIPKFLTVKAREGGPGSKIRFPLFFDNQIFHLCRNHYFLQNADIFWYAQDIGG